MTQAIAEEMLRQIEHIGHAVLKLRIISGMMLILSILVIIPLYYTQHYLNFKVGETPCFVLLHFS